VLLTITRRKEISMPEACIDIPVENIAGMIKEMGKRELETLCLLLTDQGLELQKRKDELDSGTVQPISRDEVFDV